MAQVSVGKLENLQSIISALRHDFEELDSKCQELIRMSHQTVRAAEEEADHSAKLLEGAIENERSMRLLLDAARTQLCAAQGNLAIAESSLAFCLASVIMGAGGVPLPPDCSSEYSEVSSAKAELRAAQSEVERAEQALEEAQKRLARMEQRNDLAQLRLRRANSLLEKVQVQSEHRMINAKTLLDAGNSRLRSALSDLERYMAGNVHAAEFYNWHSWQAPRNIIIDPKTLNERLSLSSKQLPLFNEYLIDTNPAYREKIKAYKRELSEAKGPAEVLAVQLKMRKNLSGYFSEKIVEHALRPLGEKVDTQKTTRFEDGSSTRTDLVVEDLKNPVILGKGEGMSAKQGGSIAIEVKTGSPGYLLSQSEHMKHQARGHQDASSSVTICTRDIKELDPQDEIRLRENLRNAGSPMIGMLPKKEEIDKALWEELCKPSNDFGENHER